MKNRIINVFLLVLLIALLAQSLIWHKVTLIDESLWVGRAEQLATDWNNGNHQFDQNKYSEHPGMPVLMLAAGILLAGVSASNSLTGAVVIVVSVVIAGLVTLMWWVEEKTWWWMGAGVIMAAHPLYFQASPVDAVIAPLIVLLLTLIYVLLADKGSERLVWLGLMLAGGLALSTRMHFAIILLLPVVSVLLINQGWKLVLTWVIGSLGVAWATNPLLWYTPTVFLRSAFVDQLGFFTGSALESSVGQLVSPERFLTHAPLALLSVFLLVSLYVLKRQELSISNSFVLLLLLSTAVPFLVLMKSQLQSLRYYFSLFFLWEAFLPLWLWKMAEVVKIKWPNQGWAVNHLGQILIAFLVTCQLIMVLYVYYLPTVVIINR